MTLKLKGKKYKCVEGRRQTANEKMKATEGMEIGENK